MKTFFEPLAARAGTRLVEHTRLVSARAQQWRTVVEADAATQPRRGTRVGRTSGALLASSAIAALLASSLVHGAVAASFNLADQPLLATVENAHGQGLVATMTGNTRKHIDGSTEEVATLHGAAASASLDSLCATITQNLLGRTYTLVAKADGKTTAKDLKFDAFAADANDIVLTGNGTQIGRSADELTYKGQSIGGQPGGFGIDGPDATFSMSHIVLTAYGAELLGSLDISHIKVDIKQGDVKC